MPGRIKLPRAGRRRPGGERMNQVITPTIGARDLAKELGKPQPTDQQVDVIESELQPLLVVAGAGSGKTATMTDRVVYLVANGLVAPSEILGLTFTRKAASELQSRIERHLRSLARSGIVPAGTASAELGLIGSLTERPRISTYNAYAAQLVRDHGIRLGLENDQTLIGEAGRYQLASQVVESWAGDLDLASAPITVVRAVVTLAGELAEHMLTPTQAKDQLLAIADELADAAPIGKKKEPYAEVAKVIASLRARASLIPLIEGFSAAKRARGAMDFADQVASAARLAADFPVVAERERATARVVLLDEYQDTSVAQLAMLRALFGDGHPVTAVGDPHQGIYGWRGASAGALLSFPTQFPLASGEPAPVAHLTTSWRNDRAVLTAATLAPRALRAPDVASNQPSAPNATQAAPPSVEGGPLGSGGLPVAVDVPPLEARPDAGAGVVRWTFADDAATEARAIAQALHTAWRPGQQTAAVLCRKRSQFEAIREALLQRGLPAQIVGLAGLLTTPEVADVRAILVAAYDPSRGDVLMRALTGPVARLGAADLHALADLAAVRTTGTRGGGGRETSDEASIVEALEHLPADIAWTSHRGRSFTQSGLDRLRRLAGIIRDVRSLTHLSLADLVVAVEQLLGLDLEVQVHSGGVSRGRADLDEFAVVASDFESSTAAPTLGAFLAWLDAAQEYERGLDAAPSEPDSGAVQIMTVHASKGLEWDVVVVAGLTEGDFPGVTPVGKEPLSSGWLTSLEALPYEMRGDAEHLPHLEPSDGANHKDVDLAREEFRAADGARELREERRLAYVAFTRARSVLVLTGCWWGTRKTINVPSRFLTEVVAAEAALPLPGTSPDALMIAPEQSEPTPLADAIWPAPRDGELLRELEQAATLIPVTSPASPGVEPPAQPEHTLSTSLDAAVAEWAWQTTTLLAEQAASTSSRTTPTRGEIPEHLSASAVVALASDPAEFALVRRRPVPVEPSPYARRGTRFHAWVEAHYAQAALLDVDDLGEAEDVVAEDDQLLRLQEAFLASPWAGREPIAIEADVETPVAGTVVRCRIDAVFAGTDGALVHIVDWKTGAPASGVKAREAREMQLALYRLGWSRLHGVPLNQIAASFHFVASGVTHDAPLLEEAEVEKMLARHLAALGPTGADQVRTQ